MPQEIAKVETTDPGIPKQNQDDFSLVQTTQVVVKDSKSKPKKQTIENLSSFEKYSRNPSIDPYSKFNTLIAKKKKYYQVTASTEMITNRETGVITKCVEQKIVHYVDQENFVKIFTDGMRQTYNLSRAGIQVFTFLLEIVQNNPNSDKLYLHYMDAIEEPHKISKDIFYRGLKELVQKNFIFSSNRPNMYWLNIKMLFNGDRLRFVNEYVIDEVAAKIFNRDEDLEHLDDISNRIEQRSHHITFEDNNDENV